MFKNFFKTLFGKKSSDEDTRKIEDSGNYWADKDAVDYLTNIISEEILVNDVKDITKAFEASANNDYKTIMKWKI